jgi:Zn-dependent peptidase ImmA (M78 family)
MNSTATTTRQEVEEAANDLLRSRWREDLATCTLPVDPFQIARALGLKIVRVPLEPDVSGMLAKHPGQDPVVYINVSDSEVRQRFSCAHEIGHYIKRGSLIADGDEWGYIDRRGPAAARGDNPEEIYANQFAAALLMPEERVKSFMEARASIVSMALQFNVSLEAMAHRIDNLGLSDRLPVDTHRAVST